MTDTPNYLQDSKALLNKDGFLTGSIWYHGTSSALVESIKTQGLIRSGDKAIKQAAKSTMATIGNSYSETIEPVFLTPSKALAYYWAKQTVRNRSARFEGEETPVVFEVALPDQLNSKVKPDVGAAGMLIVHGGGEYFEFLNSLYEQVSLSLPEFDLSAVKREDYISQLGMAYIDSDIPAEHLRIVSET